MDVWTHPITVTIVGGAFTLIGGVMIAGLIKLIGHVRALTLKVELLVLHKDNLVADCARAQKTADAAHRRIDDLEHERSRQ